MDIPPRRNHFLLGAPIGSEVGAGKGQMHAEEQIIWCQAAITTVSQALLISPSKSTDEYAALQNIF
jgi:hypothetical protein